MNTSIDTDEINNVKDLTPLNTPQALGVPAERLFEYYWLMSLPMNEWPDSLKEFCSYRVSMSGWCADVASCFIAEWFGKTNENNRF